MEALIVGQAAYQSTFLRKAIAKAGEETMSCREQGGQTRTKQFEAVKQETKRKTKMITLLLTTNANDAGMVEELGTFTKRIASASTPPPPPINNNSVSREQLQSWWKKLHGTDHCVLP
jgi:hypothetical protein